MYEFTKEVQVQVAFGKAFICLLSTIPLWHFDIHFVLDFPGIVAKVWMIPPSSCASFQLIAHFLMLMVLGWG